MHKSKLAELVGIILGDGSLYINRKSKVYQFVITGHAQNDKDYLINFVKPLIENCLDKKVSVRILRNNAIQLRIQQKVVIEYFKKLGLPAGNKISNNSKIPDWVFENENCLRACIRGMIDTDGSVCPITGRNYSYIWFFSKNSSLQISFDKAMKKLGFKTSKWYKRKGHGDQIYIGSKAMIRKYFKEIGFNNSYHQMRFMLPSSSPVKDTSQ